MNVNRPDYAGRGRDALGAIFDGIVAEAAAQPSAKAEAIANADAHTNNAGLPTYSELVEALRRIRQHLADDYYAAADCAAADTLARIPA